VRKEVDPRRLITVEIECEGFKSRKIGGKRELTRGEWGVEKIIKQE